MSQELKISVSAFKAKALHLFEEIGKQNKSIIVTKHGKPMAKVIPFGKGLKKSYKPGGLENTLLHEEDIVSPLGAELWEASKE